MNLRKLGQSDLKITPIGIGAWAIGGGKWEFAWGAQEIQSQVLIEALAGSIPPRFTGWGISSKWSAAPSAGSASVLMSSPSAAWFGMDPGRAQSRLRP